jgi:hypothetical protein
MNIVRTRSVTLSKISTLDKDQFEVSSNAMITEIGIYMGIKDSSVVPPPPIHHR